MVVLCITGKENICFFRENIDKFHFAVYILIFDPSPVLSYGNCIASASGANPLHLLHHQLTQFKGPLHCHLRFVLHL